MKQALFLSLVLSCFFIEAAVSVTGDGSVHGQVYNAGNFSSTFMAFRLGVLKQKIAHIEKSLNLELIIKMEREIRFLETTLQESRKEIVELRSLLAGPKVAFAATLNECGSGDTGPYSVNTTLKYERVFSNTGDGYDPKTGLFTAPEKGMYFFRFSMFKGLFSTSVVSLMKDDQRLTSVWDTSRTDSNDMGSNAVVISLDVGDTVYVQLLSSRIVYDDELNHNTFSGFLLFPM